MANIALDIKANTSKALGEFKKLSSSLDNKFLVQGLKLDVVKNAFRQITKEFDTAIGDQGFKTAESTGQLQRSLQLQLGTLRKFNDTVNKEVSDSIFGLLSDLRERGTITGETLKETLDISALLDFEGTTEQRKKGFKDATNDIALFIQQSKDLFGGSEAELIRKGISGALSVDDLLNLNLTSAGASGNKFKLTLTKYADALRSTDPSARTEAYLKVIRELQADPEYQKAFKDIKPISALFREIGGLFEPTKGLFGALRSIGPDIKNLSGRTVDRNLLQVTAKLLGTIFDREKGLFAALFKSLKEIFGTGDPLNVILTGVEFLTSVLEKVRDFFASPAFKNFLKVFTPIADAIRNLDVSNITFDLDTIKGFIGNIGNAIRELFNKSAEFIRKLDTKAVSEVLGTIIKELVKTIPSLLNLVFSSLGKVVGVLFDTINSSGGSATLIYSAIIAGFVNFADKLFGGPGLIGRLRNVLLSAFGGFARRLGIGSGTGFGASRTGTQRALDSQKTRRESIFRAGITSRLNSVIRLLGGQASPGDFGRGRGGPRRGTPGRDGRTASQRARDIARIRNNSRIPAPRIPVSRRSGPAGLIRNFVQRTSRIPAVSSAIRNPLMGLNRNFRTNRSAYTRPIGPLSLNSEDDWARRGRLDPRSMGGGTLYSPRLESSVRPSRFSQARDGVRNFGGGISQGVNQRLRGGFGMNKGNALNKALIGTPRADVAARFGSRFGTRGILGRGLRRVPLLGTLLAGAGIAAALSTPGASAAEMEGLTPEQKREQRRQDERGKTRGVLGVLGGVAGGAAGGAALGTLVGGPVGTIIGGIIGGIVGEEAVKFLSDPIIDGITDFGKGVGSFFSGLWKGTSQLFGDGWKAVTNFFGPEGPIQSTFKFVVELPGKMVGGIKKGFEAIRDKVVGLPATLWKSITEGFTGKQPEASTTDKKFLGGVGRGMTLVGENGPELVNLGSGSVVTPMTSFAGLGLNRGGSSGQTTNNVVINVNAPGADEFADQLSVQVIEKLDEMLEEQKALQGK